MTSTCAVDLPTANTTALHGAVAASEARVAVVVSVDTEEDQWGPHVGVPTAHNIAELPRFQTFAERLGLRPTYFANYHAVSRPSAAAVIADLAKCGQAEIGAHLHPWNTPPIVSDQTAAITMLCNLPAAIQEAKIEAVTRQLSELVGTHPRSFRAGRYGIGLDSVRTLVRLNYEVDSSVTPFLDWRWTDNGPDFRRAPQSGYRIGTESLISPAPDGELVELPISVGYSRRPFSLWHQVYELLHARPLRPLRLIGAASRTNLFRKIVLTPEGEQLRDLIRLSRVLIEGGTSVLHLTLHSPSLTPGLSPFTATRGDVDRLYATLEGWLTEVSRMACITPMTVTEAAQSLVPPRLLRR